MSPGAATRKLGVRMLVARVFADMADWIPHLLATARIALHGVAAVVEALAREAAEAAYVAGRADQQSPASEADESTTGKACTQPKEADAGMPSIGTSSSSSSSSSDSGEAILNSSADRARCRMQSVSTSAWKLLGAEQGEDEENGGSLSSIIASLVACEQTQTRLADPMLMGNTASGRSLAGSAEVRASSPRSLLAAIALAGGVSAAHVGAACLAAQLVERDEAAAAARDRDDPTGAGTSGKKDGDLDEDLKEPVPHPLGFTPARVAALVPRLVDAALGLGTRQRREILEALARVAALCEAGTRLCGEAAASAADSASGFLDRLKADQSAVREGLTPPSLAAMSVGEREGEQPSGGTDGTFDLQAAQGAVRESRRIARLAARAAAVAARAFRAAAVASGSL